MKMACCNLDLIFVGVAIISVRYNYIVLSKGAFRLSDNNICVSLFACHTVLHTPTKIIPICVRLFNISLRHVRL